MPTSSLHDVFRATIVAKILYGSPAWSGMCSAADRSRLNAFLRRCKRYNYTVPMTFQLLKNCSLTLTIHYLNALSSARLTPHPYREIWTTIQPARKATQLLSCREDFRTERTWLHYAYFVQRELLVPFLFSILFIFDVALCQLVFLHEYMMIWWYDDMTMFKTVSNRWSEQLHVFMFMLLAQSVLPQWTLVTLEDFLP